MVKEYPAFKPQEELFRLIPSGYLSFLILTILVGWLFTRIYKEGNVKSGLTFGAIVGGMYALAMIFGWYSAFELPLVFVCLASAGYFIEILSVGFVFGYLIFIPSIKRRIWTLTAIIVGGFILSVVIQNLMK